MHWHGLRARLDEADARLKYDPIDEGALAARAAALDELGLIDDAIEAYVRLLHHDGSQPGPFVRLGSLLATQSRIEPARTVFGEAALRFPTHSAAHTGLGNVLIDAGDAAGARAAFAAALQIDPDDATAHRGIAILLEREGAFEAAARAWSRAFPEGRLVFESYHGIGPPVRVLLLGSALGGNIPLRLVLNSHIFQVATLIVEAYRDGVVIPEHDVVMNGVGDAYRSARALLLAERIVARLTTPIVNLPARVRATTRVEVARRIADIPGVIVPPIASVPRAELLAHDAAQRLAERGFTFPLLLRSPGYHTGEHFERVETADDLRAAADALPGDALLVIGFVDTAGPDGAYRKYRAMTIAGGVYPLHLAISPGWKVHYFTSAMADDDAFRAEEEAFLADPAAAVGLAAMGALAAIAERLGLDYGGVDFGIARDGRIVVFEANATMVLLPPPTEAHFAYRRPYMERAITAARAMLQRRAGLSNDAPGEPVTDADLLRFAHMIAKAERSMPTFDIGPP